MPWRLWRRIKIAPGVTINVSKSGLSTSIGPRGAKVTVGKNRIRRTVGLPGTGLYFTSSSKRSDASTNPGPGPTGSALEAPATEKPRPRIGCFGWAVGAVVVLAAIGSVTGLGNAAPTPGPTAGTHGIGDLASGSLGPGSSQAQSDPPTSTSEPSAEPAPTTRPAALSIKITKSPGKVSRNAYATLTAKAPPGARCSIDVAYSSGSSTASGLGDKKVGSSGVVTWKWRVGSNTAKGSWPIYISCSLNGRNGDVTTSIKVV